MATHRARLPQLQGGRYLAYTGMETDLIFTRGVDLPGFASYPLLDTDDGRRLLSGYFRDLIAVARAHGAGAILEGPTWVANRDRGAALGHSTATLREANRRAIALMAEVRDAEGDLPTVLSANIGPRGDAYAPEARMSAAEAQDYHAEQVSALAETEVDQISGYTLACPDEATGMARAARAFGLPVVIAFTVETDGRLPTGAALADAIAQVDATTDRAVAYFMINCAHPDHFGPVLSDTPALRRVRGLVANASRRSHAELDAAETLDAGDPDELGRQMGDIARRFPWITVLGGCCGTDMRHLSRIAAAAGAA